MRDGDLRKRRSVTSDLVVRASLLILVLVVNVEEGSLGLNPSCGQQRWLVNRFDKV